MRIFCKFWYIQCIFLANLSAFWHQPKYAFYKEKPDIFPLGLLPIEIQNEIAQYLPFRSIETDQEFIERLKKMDIHFSGKRSFLSVGKFYLTSSHENSWPVLYRNDNRNYQGKLWQLPKKSFSKFFRDGPVNIDHITIAPDFSVVAILILFDCFKEHRLFICNMSSKRLKIKLRNTIDRIAIAPSGKRVAFERKYWNEIQILDVKTGKVNPINELPIILHHSKHHKSWLSVFEFNKQGTKLGGRYDTHVRLVSIDSNEPKKSLALYLRERGVCKNWPQKKAMRND